jgi:hypothetical protein
MVLLKMDKQPGCCFTTTGAIPLELANLILYQRMHSTIGDDMQHAGGKESMSKPSMHHPEKKRRGRTKKGQKEKEAKNDNEKKTKRWKQSGKGEGNKSKKKELG